MYKINDDRMFCDVSNGQVIIIDFTTGIYYGSTNAVDGYVLDKLIKGYTPEAIAEKAQEFKGVPANFSDILGKYVQLLVDKGILLPGNDNANDLPEIEGMDFDPEPEDYLLNLQEFSEIQELLLADPIHEADIDAGWPVFKDVD